MRFREHRGTLAASMETLREFATAGEFVAYLATLWMVEGPFKLELYVDHLDDRIGWPQTWLLSDRHGVVGMTDGPIPEDHAEIIMVKQ